MEAGGKVIVTLPALNTRVALRCTMPTSGRTFSSVLSFLGGDDVPLASGGNSGILTGTPFQILPLPPDLGPEIFILTVFIFKEVEDECRALVVGALGVGRFGLGGTGPALTEKDA